MTYKKASAIALAAIMAVSLFGPSAALAKKKKKAKGPFVMGTDPAGDWGASTDPAIAPLGDLLGQDVVEAAIEDASENLNFIITVNALPATGGAPEITRYTWDFVLDGEPLELDGKWSNYSRGACDPTAGSCPPPRDPGQQPFLVRGKCTTEDLVATTFTFCEELSKVQAIFDPAKGTITIPVPKADIGAKPGSKITPGTNTFAGSLSAAPSAWATYGTFPMDTMVMTETFVVPKK